MKELLRGIFSAKPEEDRDLLLRNFQNLRDSGLGFNSPEDVALWNYIQDFVSSHHHVPDLSTLRDHWTHYKEREILDRLDILEATPLKLQGDFKKSLESHVRDMNTRRVQELLREAASIVQTGITVKDERGKDMLLRGPVDAVKHFLNKGQSIVTPATGTNLSGNVVIDGAAFMREYERVEADPLAGIGQFSGLRQMDQALSGAKRGELWTHAAFTGGLKTTLALNWVYNQAIFYGHSSVFFSLEMPYQQVRRILYAMHSEHEKFKDIRKRLGISRSLDYSRIRDGMLDVVPEDKLLCMPESERQKLLPDTLGRKCINPARPERRFLFEYVIPDFGDPRNNYGGIHIEVADPDKSDFTVQDIRARAELLYANDPNIAMIVVDHALLVSPRVRYKSTSENANDVIRDLKRVAMSFNRGAGIAMIALFQISREGFKSAEKNDGRYNLTHLSYANECERSSDVVTASWVDEDLRQRSMVQFQCLKTRDNKPFDSFFSGVYWPCRRIYTVYDVPGEEAAKTGDVLDGIKEAFNS